MKFRVGPGALVAAAFIGPGTVTACTVAGANFGYALLWALGFATIATMILQEMAARLGSGARLGLSEALIQYTTNPLLKWAMIGLVMCALAVGNAAYEAGNLAGGALGVEALAGKEGLDRRIVVLGLATISAGLLFFGGYKTIERVLIGLVVIMGAAFVAAAIMVQPDWSAFARGFIPSVPDGSTLLSVALIGTTIVPYNLFLHAATARERWRGDTAVSDARADTFLSIGLGGIVSILIISTAASSLFANGITVSNANDMALALEPTFGSAARILIGVGLLAAGTTSAITAPMATGYAVSEIFGGKNKQRRKLIFRSVALAIILIGASISITNIKPVSLILVAQVANALLLPIIAFFLLLVMNNKKLLGGYNNGPLSNIAGAMVILITLLIASRGILRALGYWP